MYEFFILSVLCAEFIDINFIELHQFRLIYKV